MCVQALREAGGRGESGEGVKVRTDPDLVDEHLVETDGPQGRAHNRCDRQCRLYCWKTWVTLSEFT